MDSLRNKIIHILERFSVDEDLFITEIKKLGDRYGGPVYSELIHLLTHLELTNGDAERAWSSIISHHEEMKSDSRNSVSLRAAVCNYFCTVHKCLVNPKIIEMHLYEKTARQSKYDELTGLLNRRVFNEVFSREVSRAERHGDDLSFLFFDLDDFKSINDRFGHAVGDLVISTVAGIIISNKRHEDIAARYGGEEFVLVLPETGKTHAFEIGERIRKEVERLDIQHEGAKVSVTLSGGLSSFPYDTSDPLRLNIDADSALLQAKKNGKNSIEKFSADNRRFVRVGCSGEITLKELDISENQAFTGVCKNISRGGVLIGSTSSHPPGTRLLARIPLMTDSTQLVAGTVVRVTPAEDDHFDVGLAFLDVERKASHKLLGYILNRA